MNPHVTQSISIGLGVAGGIILSSVILFFAAQWYIEHELEELEAAIQAETEKAATERLIKKKALENFQRGKAREQAKQRRENSDQCRFWKQQLGINSEAENKVKQYCWKGK